VLPGLRGRVVARAVVDDQDVELRRGCMEAVDHSADRGALVQRRNDDEARRLASLAPIGHRVAPPTGTWPCPKGAPGGRTRTVSRATATSGVAAGAAVTW